MILRHVTSCLAVVSAVLTDKPDPTEVSNPLIDFFLHSSRVTTSIYQSYALNDSHTHAPTTHASASPLFSLLHGLRRATLASWTDKTDAFEEFACSCLGTLDALLTYWSHSPALET